MITFEENSVVNIRNFKETNILKNVFDEAFDLMKGKSPHRNSPIKKIILNSYAEDTECRDINKYLQHYWEELKAKLYVRVSGEDPIITKIKEFYSQLIEKQSYNISVYMLRVGADLEKYLCFSNYYGDNSRVSKPIFTDIKDLKYYGATNSN